MFICAEDPRAGILGVGDLSFTSSGAAQPQGAADAESAIGKKGWKTAHVLLDDPIEYDKLVCAGFDWMYPKKGGEIVAHDTSHTPSTVTCTKISWFGNSSVAHARERSGSRMKQAASKIPG